MSKKSIVTRRNALSVHSIGGLTSLMMDDNLDMRNLRTFALLRKDEWKVLDDAVSTVPRPILVAVNDLRNAGLVRNLGGLGVMIDEWESASDMATDAAVDMSGIGDTDEDSIEFTTHGVPIPIFSKPYRINIRRLLASRRNGTPIESMQAERATRKVAERLEGAVFNGVNIKGESYTFYGYTNFPERVQVDVLGEWDTTPTNSLTDIETLLAAADAAYYRGPFTLYVPSAWYSALRGDQNAYKSKTILQRCLDYNEIASIKPSFDLDSDECVMVQLSRDVVDLSVGSDFTNIMWNSNGGLIQHMRVLAAMAIRLKPDDNGTSGVFHGAEVSS